MDKALSIGILLLKGQRKNEGLGRSLTVSLCVLEQGHFSPHLHVSVYEM